MSFETSNADYYYSGWVGSRLSNTEPNAASGVTGASLTTQYTGEQMGTVSGSASFGCATNLPDYAKQFLIISDTSGRDPNTGGNLRYVPTQFNGGEDTSPLTHTHITRSIRVGNGCPNAEAAALYYNMRVTPDNALLYLYYALVAQQPGHGVSNDPVFYIRVTKRALYGINEWGQVSDTLAYAIPVTPVSAGGTVANGQDGWHLYNQGYDQIYYRDWDLAVLDLSPYLYENVRIEFISADCSYSGHYSYAYLAGECRPLQLEGGACSGTEGIVTAANGMDSYSWLASELGQVATTPGSDIPMRTIEQYGTNMYTPSADGFRVTRRVNSLGDTVAVDSTAMCQTFGCEITSHLDPAKPSTSRLYIDICNTDVQLTFDTAVHCGGEVMVANRSTSNGAAVPYTEWEFYANGQFEGTPLLTSNADSLTANFAGQTVIGVVMRTGASPTDCLQEARFVLQIPVAPQVQVIGSTHLYPGTPTDLTATADMGCTFQWSTTRDSVSGGLPAGARLRTVPYADTATYYIRATAGGCTVWDSVLVTAYDTSRHELMNHLFYRIKVDTLVCLGDSRTVGVGHDEHNDVVVTDQHATLSHPGRVFLPDGQPCGDNGCSYQSPVTFDNFSQGATVSSANDINYVRLNLEHSYIGDIYIGITCPNGQRATIMKKNSEGMNSQCAQSIPTNARGWTSGSNTNGGTFFGDAFDSEDYYNLCDSTRAANEAGIGWNYCWSNSTTAGNSYAPGDALIYRSASTHNGKVDSSNVAMRTNFYHPDQNFSSLVGCPLNGTWYIEVIDGYSQDNGYIFDWELSLTTSAIDSTIVITSSEIVGNTVGRINDSVYSLSAPAEAVGDTTVRYIILLFDSLGIVADTSVYVHYVAPTYYSRSAERCDGDTLRLGSEVFTSTIYRQDTVLSDIGCPIYREIDFVFHPVYEPYDTVGFCPHIPLVHDGILYDTVGDYLLKLQSAHQCDSLVHLHMHIQDSGFHAAFEISDDARHWSQDTMLAGCSPFTVWLHDLSYRALSSQWLVGADEDVTGDSTSYDFSTEGLYTITLLTASEHGCVDTATIADAVWVFGHSEPAFSWNPQYPVSSHPTVEFYNATEDSARTTYMWRIASSDNSEADTSSATAPTYTWGDGSEPVSGDFDVTLVSIKAHITPTGDTAYCTDSTTLTVSIVNDWLQFPNLVTPNGDGVNDTWEIINLVEEGIYTMNELWIYNAWGARVFHAKDISKKSDFWDPNATNSPDGTYFFHFTAKSPYGVVKYNGTIEVLRGNE